MTKQHGLTVFLLAVTVVFVSVVLVKSPGFAGDEPQKGDSPAEETQDVKPDAVTTATGKPWEHGENMDAVVEFVMKNRMGFLATVDAGKPRVRAWGFMKYEEGRFYFGTANTKDVFVQLNDVPYAEWISMDPQTYSTLRIFGKVVFVDDIEIKRQIIADNPMIKDMYAGEKEKEFEVFYLTDIKTNWFSFAPIGEAPQEDTD
jgi:uncharacterized pyridoxamine 5'-phosphate oxidase family protein